MVIEQDVQKKVLRAILMRGGKAKVREIMESTNLNKDKVWTAVKHLRSRALISKKNVAFKHGKLSIFTLNERLLPKINKLISEIRE